MTIHRMHPDPVAPTIELKLRIDNIYEGGDEVTNHLTVQVPAPDLNGDVAEWAEDHLYPLTGTGRESGDAGYFVEILDGPAELKGREFEWGT